MSAGAPVWKVASVWAARLLTGAVFILSGWAKAVDPRGFVYKIGEYLAVWGIDRLIPYELVILGAVVLSVVELTIGVLLATGCLRRSTPICGLVMMLFMLPLTVYIAVADPVADCGCFGDLLVISNTATMLKNVALTALLVLCLVWHKAARPLYRPGLQWLVIALSCVYGLVLAVIGWQFQPVADFRPYGVGKTLVADDGTSGAERYVYEKNGERREYTLDMLPDSTWTFVERAGGASEATREGLAVFDGDDEVTVPLDAASTALPINNPNAPSNTNTFNFNAFCKTFPYTFLILTKSLLSLCSVFLSSPADIIGTTVSATRRLARSE